MPAKVVSVPLNSQAIVAETVRRIKRMKSVDALMRLAVIVPSYYAGIYQREAVSASFENGLFNVEFMRIGDLAERLAGGSARLTEKPLLRRVQGIELARLADSDSGTGSPRGDRAVYRSLYSAYQELELLPKETTTIRRETDAQDRRLLANFGNYRKLASGFRTNTDTLRAAAELISSEPESVKRDIGAVIALAVGHPQPADMPVWRALADAPNVVIIAADPEDGADRRSPFAFLHSKTPAREESMQEYIAKPKPVKKETSLFAALSKADEVRAVTRNVLRLARGGVPLSKIAILYDNPTYAGHISDALETAGIGRYVPIHYPIAKQPEGRFVQKVIAMAEADLSVEGFAEWLSSAPIRRPGYSADEAAIPATRWRRLTRGMTRRSVSDRKWEDGLEAAAISSFVGAVRRDLTFPSEGTYSGWADWLRTFCNRYMPVKFLGDAERFFRLLDTIANLESVAEGSAITFEMFKETVLDEMEASTSATRTGLNTGEVFVAPVRSAAGCAFDAVHILGMADGTFPSKPGRKPFLDDDARRRLDETGEFLPTSDQETRAERSGFLAALNSAPLRFLYWNVSGGEEGTREIPPSPWFIEQARAVTGSPQLQVKDLLAFSEPVELVNAVPAADKVAESASLSEFDTAAAAAHIAMNPQDPQAGRTHTLAREIPHIGRALHLLHSRNSSAFTEFDGNVGDSGSTVVEGSHTISATEFEDYAACPFRYFLGRVLHLPDSDDATDDYTISAADRGTLVHRILQEFVNERMKSAEMSEAAQRKLLREISERNFDLVERESEVGLAGLWNLEKASLRSILDGWLEEDWKHSAQGWETLQTEMGFGKGMDAANPELELRLNNGASVPVRGIVDRVDVSKEGNNYFVFDYKTGSPTRYESNKNDPLRQGENLQLALYAYAVAELMDCEPDSVKAGYWFANSAAARITSGSSSPSYGSQKDLHLRLADIEELFRSYFTTVRESITAGLFPPRPGDDSKNCTYCAFKRACPSEGYRREAVWRRKKGAPALVDYVSMKNEASPTPSDETEDTE